MTVVCVLGMRKVLRTADWQCIVGLHGSRGGSMPDSTVHLGRCQAHVLCVRYVCSWLCVCLCSVCGVPAVLWTTHNCARKVRCENSNRMQLAGSSCSQDSCGSACGHSDWLPQCRTAQYVTVS